MIDIKNIGLLNEIQDVLKECQGYKIVGSLDELVELACPDEKKQYEVAYEVPGHGRVVEAEVCRVRNGVAANYPEVYMRRRDPSCMVIADDYPTDKARFKERFGSEFNGLREETFNWLKTQELALYFFLAGSSGVGLNTLVVAPANAGFFALGLALLQDILDPEELPEDFTLDAVIYVAPPFRHTHFDGKQVVVHNRLPDKYEMFSYNLYPGPSAKKGVYGMLINLGTEEEWVTLHCSTVQVVTPYGNKVTIAHEGASGGGKSEMLEHIHRQADGRLLLGHNVVNEENRYLILPRGCDLRPVTDDMALAYPGLQKTQGKLSVTDAENAWFIRVDHIKKYGTDPYLEKITCHTPEPLLFLNVDAPPQSTALIWEHIQDAPGMACPNPRVILPRRIVPNVVNGPATIDIRSFGVRTPCSTKEHPTYGIIGLFHILSPALAWLWRLVAPRGDANPSIVDTEGMSSEGVGSYWPFTPGKRIDQANLLLKQIIETPNVRYILCPNQHIGAWQVGFMPQWLVREYLARRGGAWFTENDLKPARCTLLGYALRTVMIEGHTIERSFLQVETQPEVGEQAYDVGSKILTDFFKKQLTKYLEPGLLPLGEEIINCCLSGGSHEDYSSLLNGNSIFAQDN